MYKQKRKTFFIKGNFQIVFILGFILLLFIEVSLAGIFIYKSSAYALEKVAYSSHISIDKTAQIIKPIVIKVNASVILISIILAACIMALAGISLHSLFNRIIEGLKNLKNNNTSFRISQCGGKDTRELIKEFNQAAIALDKKKNDLNLLINSILAEKDLKTITNLHQKIYLMVK